MNYKIIGIECVDYTNKNGYHVKGVKFHVTFEKKGVKGLCSDSIYVSDKVDVQNIDVGMNVTFYYNKFGQVEFVS